MLNLFLLGSLFVAPAFASNGLQVEAARVVQSEPDAGKLVVMVASDTRPETRTIDNATVLPLLQPGDVVLLYDHGHKVEAFPTQPVGAKRAE